MRFVCELHAHEFRANLRATESLEILLGKGPASESSTGEGCNYCQAKPRLPAQQQAFPQTNPHRGCSWQIPAFRNRSEAVII
jgi:hypothetical protein